MQRKDPVLDARAIQLHSVHLDINFRLVFALRFLDGSSAHCVQDRGVLFLWVEGAGERVEMALDRSASGEMREESWPGWVIGDSPLA